MTKKSQKSIIEPKKFIKPPKKQYTKGVEQKLYKKYRALILNLPKNIIHIHSTLNNTIVIVRNIKGNILSTASAGSSGFRNTKKKTPFAAQMTIEKALKNTSKKNFKKRVIICISGQTFARKFIYKKLIKSNIKIITLKDVTRIPFNGCRSPKLRRL